MSSRLQASVLRPENVPLSLVTPLWGVRSRLDLAKIPVYFM